MANQPYGDMCDVLTPDFPKQDSFRKTIGNYPAAMLFGDEHNNPEMAKILVDYVKNGGTLIINIKQLNKFYPEAFTGIRLNGDYFKQERFTVSKVDLKGASVIRRNNDGDPLMTCHNYGKGKVLVSLIHYMTPWDTARHIGYFYNSIFGAKIPVHPEIAFVLEKMNKELIPVRVKGDIQYGLNKTEKGWWLYLINNKGVIKFADKMAKYDKSKTAVVTVDLDRLKAFSKVKELRSGTVIPVKNNSFTVKVSPGDVAVLALEK